MSIAAPCHLEENHHCELFHCGEPALNAWLKNRVLKNEAARAGRTYVITHANAVVAYYSSAVGSVGHSCVACRIHRNMPGPIPIMLLARLAVDTSLQRQGIGRALLRDAILRTEQAAHIAEIRCILVHGLNGCARHFYTSSGFTLSSRVYS